MLAPRRKGRPCRNQINSIPKKNKNKKTFSLAKKRDRIRDGISERNLDDTLKKMSVWIGFFSINKGNKRGGEGGVGAEQRAETDRLSVEASFKKTPSSKKFGSKISFRRCRDRKSKSRRRSMSPMKASTHSHSYPLLSHARVIVPLSFLSLSLPFPHSFLMA